MDASCYNTIISACAKQGQPPQAEAWMKRMLQRHQKAESQPGAYLPYIGGNPYGSGGLTLITRLKEWTQEGSDL